jgi:hypothetical protein
MMEHLDALDKHSDNPYLYGLLFLLYISTSKEVTEKPAKLLKGFAKHPVTKYITVFAACFIATKKIKRALMLTVVYAVLFDGLLDPTSRFSIVGKSIPEEEEDSDHPQVVLQQQPVHTTIAAPQIKQVPIQQETFNPQPWN